MVKDTERVNMMFRRIIAAMAAVLMLLSPALADVLPPKGEVSDFRTYSGISATRAYVLCESLTVRADRDQSAKAVATLKFGESFLTWESWDGWCNCYYSDGREVGWVKNQYVVIDPAMYVTTTETPVYAYPDSMKRVALLDPGLNLPIIHDSGEWYVVSLRGASGWIRKTPQDTASDFWFRPEMLGSISAATLSVQYNGQSYDAALTDPARLAELAALLSDAEDQGAPMAGCPFGLITLTLLTANGSITLDVAADSCNIYRVDGARDYAYSESADEDAPDPDKEDIFRIFGMDNPFPY